MSDLSAAEQLGTSNTEELAFHLWRALRRIATVAGQVAYQQQIEDDKPAEPVRTIQPDSLDRAISRVLTHLPAAEGSDRELISLCERIAAWATDYALPTTGVLFAEAATSLRPEDARLANLAGRTCRMGGLPWRAEIWYERAAGLARGSRNVPEYIRANLGWGNLLRDLGQHHRALPKIRRAGVRAKSAGLKSTAAEALHDIFTIELLRKNFPRAAILAKRTLVVYPRHHRRFPYFAADLCALLVRVGLYTESLPVLQHVLSLLSSPVELLQVQGLIAWAASGAGEDALYRSAQAEAFRGAQLYPSSAPGTLYALAEGARIRIEWDRAAELAAHALTAAEETGDHLTRSVAGHLQKEIQRRLTGPVAPPPDDASASLLRRTTAEARNRLDRWRGPTWRPRRSS